MMLTWMLAAMLFTLCVGVAAAATERLLRAHGRAARGVWILALAVAATWPVVVPVVGSLVASTEAVSSPAVAISSTSSAAAMQLTPDTELSAWTRALAIKQLIGAHMQRAATLFASRTAWINPAVLTVWGMLSGVLLLRLLIAALHVRRLTRSATPAVVDGNAVLLAEGFGPASVGWRSPRVVVPQWVLALDTPLRALVLRHETEHCRSRDPRFVWCAAIATAVMPWNAGLWWLARRLRLALELDCDARTLQHGGDPRTYAKLLLFMTQQHDAPAAHLRLASSLAASRSHLATRISAMQQNSKLMSRGARLAAVGLAALALIGAGATRIPDTLVEPSAAHPEVPAVSAVVVDTATPARTSAERAGDTIYFEFQVEKPAAMRRGTIHMVYPQMLRMAQVEGTVLASFVVDEQGVADVSTFKVLRSDHQLFTNAVRTALSNFLYVPAEIKGQRVKQLVQQSFQFSLARTPVDSTARGGAANRTDAAGKPADAASKPADAASKPADAYFEFQVEKPAAMRPGPSTMMYPPMLRSAEVEGTVLASFVVDELGVVDLSTFTVVKADHELFTRAVRTALLEMRFVPAEVGGRKVKQLVQQPFVFRIPK